VIVEKLNNLLTLFFCFKLIIEFKKNCIRFRPGFSLRYKGRVEINGLSLFVSIRLCLDQNCVILMYPSLFILIRTYLYLFYTLSNYLIISVLYICKKHVRVYVKTLTCLGKDSYVFQSKLLRVPE